MRLFLPTLLIAALGAEAASAQRTQTVEPDRIETVRLDENGQARLRVRLDRPARLAFDLFYAPLDAGTPALSLPPQGGSVEDEDVSNQPPPLRVLGPGRHDVMLSVSLPSGAAAIEIQGRLRTEPPYDAFEPNDDWETAYPIDLPFHRVISTSGGGGEDWFRVDPPNGGVIGITVYLNGGDYDGLQFEVRGQRGEQLLLTSQDNFGAGSTRYVRAQGRRLYVGVRDRRGRGDNDAAAFKSLEIIHYPVDMEMTGRLITLSLDEDDPSLFQLDLVGEAMGQPVRTADEAEDVAAELARVVEPRRGGLVLWIALGGGLIVLLGAGYYLGWRRLSAREAELAATDSAPAESTTGDSPDNNT